MTCGERNLSAHIFLRARILLKQNNEKMNLENNYFKK